MTKHTCFSDQPVRSSVIIPNSALDSIKGLNFPFLAELKGIEKKVVIPDTLRVLWFDRRGID
jgi:hypothetical protein